jgi:hypothetical protein
MNRSDLHAPKSRVAANRTIVIVTNKAAASRAAAKRAAANSAIAIARNKEAVANRAAAAKKVAVSKAVVSKAADDRPCAFVYRTAGGNSRRFSWPQARRRD